MLNRGNHNQLHDYVESRLSEYLDGALPAPERAVVQAHLNECERCAASLASLRWTVGLLKQAPAPALPRSFALPVPAAARAPERRASGWGWGLAFASTLAGIAF